MDKKNTSCKKSKVPWITKDGCFDITRYPVDSLLSQSLSSDEEAIRSACILLSSQYSAGRRESAICLYGLFIFHGNNRKIKECIIEAMGDIGTAAAASLLFDELNRTKSSNSTRAYIDLILTSLSRFPLELVEDNFNALIADDQWSHRMKRKFQEVLLEIRHPY